MWGCNKQHLGTVSPRAVVELLPDVGELLEKERMNACCCCWR